MPKKWGGRRPKPHTPADAPPPDSGQKPSALGKDTGQPLPRASRAVRNLPTSSASCRCEDAGPSQTSAALDLKGLIDSKHGLEIGKEADRREEDLPQKGITLRCHYSSCRPLSLIPKDNTTLYPHSILGNFSKKSTHKLESR